MWLEKKYKKMLFSQMEMAMLKIWIQMYKTILLMKIITMSLMQQLTGMSSKYCSIFQHQMHHIYNNFELEIIEKQLFKNNTISFHDNNPQLFLFSSFKYKFNQYTSYINK